MPHIRSGFSCERYNYRSVTTARSNQVATVYDVQDVTQIGALTSQQESELSQANLNSLSRGTFIAGGPGNTFTPCLVNLR